MTISEGVKPVDHRNLKAWVRSSVVNLKTNAQSYHTKKAISEGQNIPREHTTEQGQNPCEGEDGARNYWVAKW